MSRFRFYDEIQVQESDTASAHRRRCEHCDCKLRAGNLKSVCALCFERWRRAWFAVVSRRPVNHVGKSIHG